MPPSNPDGVDANVRRLGEVTIASITMEPIDGRNREADDDALAHLSR